MERQRLDFQADRIEAVLARHKVSGRVSGGFVFPRWIQFQILPSLGARINTVRGLAEELALALGSDTCRITRRGSVMAVEIPRTDPKPVRLLWLYRLLSGTTQNQASGPMAVPHAGTVSKPNAIPFGTAILGLADDGVPLLVRLPSPQVAHLLIAGTTGSGKSALAQSIIASLVLRHSPSQIGLILIDPKRRAFGPLAGLPHVLQPVLSQAESVTRTLETLVELMLMRDKRAAALEDDGVRGEPRIVIVIDELADLLMVTGTETQRALTRIAQRGREAGIHLIACTQKPASQVVGSLAKANFPVRLVGRVTSAEDAKVATGYPGTGAERLGGCGDFIAVTGGKITHFQAAYISARELASLVALTLEDERNEGSGKTAFRSTAQKPATLDRSRDHFGPIGRVSGDEHSNLPPVQRLSDGRCE